MAHSQLRHGAGGGLGRVFHGDAVFLGVLHVDVSTPTPPRMMSRNLPPAASSMCWARTLVALRTTTASNSRRAAPNSSGG